MAQAILDAFPDMVSEYGLLGCGTFTLSILVAIGWIGIGLNTIVGYFLDRRY